MTSTYHNKNILITGGCGSVGSEIIKELENCTPKVIRIYDKDENGLYNLKNKISKRDKLDNIRYLLGDIRDKDRIKRATEDIDIIIHTAALKHVFFCEYNPFEALKTNVQGTQNVIDAAMENNVEKMIFTSSDKAVNPSNVMGITKLLAERLVVSANYYKGKRKTKFSCLRFGNIFGSNGSVVSLFKNQIKDGGPITLTHPKMTRFIMTVKEATNFIFSAIDKTQGGEIFVSKMDALKISDLVDTMINKYAKGSNIEIKQIGMGPGEKLYEELLTETEINNAYENDQMYVVVPEFTDLNEFKDKNMSEYSKIHDKKNANINSNLSPHIKSKQIEEFINKIFGEI
jgi:UDP-N-acetylglucosamine 4,6-dehydratase/5-epimerase